MKATEPAKKTQKKKHQKATPGDNVTDKPEDEMLSEQEYNDAMIDWALDGFLPGGRAGFAPTEGLFKSDVFSLKIQGKVASRSSHMPGCSALISDPLPFQKITSGP